MNKHIYSRIGLTISTVGILILTSGCETGMSGPAATISMPSCSETTNKELLTKYGSEAVKKEVQAVRDLKNSEKFEAAIQAADKALSTPDLYNFAQAELYRQKAQVHLRTQEYEAAENAFRQALEFAPQGTLLRASLTGEVNDVAIVKSMEIGGRDAKPIIRIPSIIPPRAKNSGGCVVQYDIGTDGTTKNVQAVFCTEDIFVEPSTRSVQKWIFQPAYKDGKPVERKAVPSTIQYMLSDQCGQLLPAADGQYL